MTMLLDHVRATGALAPDAIDAAVQRQRIYGGSFDTALLELELVEPTALDAWLVAATGLPSAPHALLKPGPTRPWDAVPADVLGTGWVMPLAIERGRPQLVVHPEIPDTQLAGLRRAVPTAEVYVTAECCLARIASERSAAVVPQRYAVLSVAYVQSLRRASPETKPHAAAAPVGPAFAPWLTTIPTTAPAPAAAAAPAPTPLVSSTPTATAIEPDAPQARIAPPPSTARVPLAPPQVFSPPAPQPESQAAREHTGPRIMAPPVRGSLSPGTSSAAPPLTFARPPGPAVGSPPPPGAAHTEPRPPLAIPVANAMTGFASDARSHAATPVIIPDVPSQVVFVAPLRERIDLPRRELALASDRDAITDTLLRCALEFSRRCALFGVKREGLRGLEGPEGSIPVEELVVPIDDPLERALAGTTRLDTCHHGPLARAVKQSRDVPCIFEPVRVLGRSVLALYLDRDGGAFSEDDRALAQELCALASERLEVVLRKLRGQANAGTAAASAPTTAPAPAAAPAQHLASPTAPPSGAPAPAETLAAPVGSSALHLPAMVQPSTTHTPTLPPGLRPPAASTSAAHPAPLTAAQATVSPSAPPSGGSGFTSAPPPAAAASPAVAAPWLPAAPGPAPSGPAPSGPAPSGAAAPVPAPSGPAPSGSAPSGPASAPAASGLPTLIRPGSGRSSTLLGTSPAPSFAPPPRGTTLPPVSGTIQPPSGPAPASGGPTPQPTVRVTTSPAIPIPPSIPSGADAVPAAAGPREPSSASTHTAGAAPRSTAGATAGATGSRASAVTPAAPVELGAAPSDTRPPPIDLHAPSNMRTLDGELPPVRPSPPRERASTTAPPPSDAPRPVLTILASPPPPAPPPVPTFGSAPSSSGTLPPITVPPVRAGGAADPRRPDRIIDLATPITAKSRSVVTLDAEDQQRATPSDSLTARIDDALARVARGEERVGAVLAFGEGALRRVAQRFPGELDVLRRDLDVLPPPSAHGPLLRTCIDLGPQITPYLLALFDQGNAAIRFYAAFVFQELRDPQCMPRLASACFDAEIDVRTIAARVLETYSRSAGYEDAISIVRRELGSADLSRQLHATRAGGTLRDIWAVPQLIDLLGHRERPMQEAALEALCTITGQQLGLKAPRWRAWYGEHGRRHRVEWLVSTLEHKDVAVRRWGYDELRRITGQSIPYSATGEPREREAGVRRWLEWWSRDGRAAMSPHMRG